MVQRGLLFSDCYQPTVYQYNQGLPQHGWTSHSQLCVYDQVEWGKVQSNWLQITRWQRGHHSRGPPIWYRSHQLVNGLRRWRHSLNYSGKFSIIQNCCESVSLRWRVGRVFFVAGRVTSLQRDVPVWSAEFLSQLSSLKRVDRWTEAGSWPTRIPRLKHARPKHDQAEWITFLTYACSPACIYSSTRYTGLWTAI